MKVPPDIEVKFEFNNIRKHGVVSGYRPHHLVTDDYFTTGLHHYYDVETIPPGGTVYGTITFLSPEYYPHSLYIGKRIQISEGTRIVGYATVQKIFNPILEYKKIEDNVKEEVVKKFEKAADEFDFCFASPHYIGEDNQYCFFGYLFRDNLNKGVVIDFLEEDVMNNWQEKQKYCDEEGLLYSRLSIESLGGEYKRSYFRKMLRDWKYEF